MHFAGAAAVAQMAQTSTLFNNNLLCAIYRNIAEFWPGLPKPPFSPAPMAYFEDGDIVLRRRGHMIPRVDELLRWRDGKTKPSFECFGDSCHGADDARIATSVKRHGTSLSGAASPAALPGVLASQDVG
jgi:hypothetical protein